MKARERELALELRLKHQLGYGEIAKRVRVSKSTLSRWLEDVPLSDARILELRRNAWSKGEAKRERFRQTMRSKREEKERQIYKQQLEKLSKITDSEMRVAGLMLYAAEGDKKTRAEIAFTNSDSDLVLFFIEWLGRFLGIPRERLKIQLHLYDNMNLANEELFWRKKLKLKSTQLCKSQVRKVLPGKYSYPESFRHGTCKLYVGGVDKKAELMLSIKAFFDTYKGHLHA